MGMYDTIVGKCPRCGSDYFSQTKMTDCSLLEYFVGDEIPWCGGDGSFLLKDACIRCDGSVTLEVKEGRVAALSTAEPQAAEQAWGWLVTR